MIPTFVVIKKILKKGRDIILWNKRKRYFEELDQIIPASASVFSMNCFAGRIYQDLNREYNTPTAGLFFLPQDFVEIAKDITIIRNDIEEIQESKWSDVKEVIEAHGKYPIGRIKETDIEIHFLHYKTFDEAKDKWTRRIDRFNFDEYYLIAFCQNGWRDYSDYYKDFSLINHKYKILFANDDTTSKSYNSVVFIPEFKKFKDSPDPYKFADIYYKYLINSLKKLNSVLL